jgi:hypothetical protein
MGAVAAAVGIKPVDSLESGPYLCIKFEAQNGDEAYVRER